MIDKDARDPALPRGYPFTGVQSNNYWSSTTNASYSYTDAAWDMNLNFGVLGANVKGNSAYVWPVRGGR